MTSASDRPRQNALGLSEPKAPEPLARLHSHTLLHCSLALIMASGILFLYYGYSYGRLHQSLEYLHWFWPWFSLELRIRLPGMLMLIPILYCALAFRWKHSLIAVALLLASIGPHVLRFSWEISTALASLSLLALPAIVIVSYEIKHVSDAKDRLAREERKKQQAEINRRLFIAQEDERTRISRELHDGVVQNLLYTASLASSALESASAEHDTARGKMERVVASCMSMVVETRGICQDLRPNTLSLGLVPALRSLCDEFQQETGVEAEFISGASLRELTQEETMAFFRVVQAALSNVSKHSGASRVRVAVTHLDGRTTIEVGDNGRGFAMTGGGHAFAVHGKLGLLSMEQRAEAIGGRLEVRSARGLGTLIRITLGAGTNREMLGADEKRPELDGPSALSTAAVRPRLGPDRT